MEGALKVKKILVFPVVLVLMLILARSSSNASQSVVLSFDELSTNADAIVTCVLSKADGRIADGVPSTLYTFKVVDVFKNSSSLSIKPDANFSFSQMGVSSADAVRLQRENPTKVMNFPGVMVYKPGETYTLFLKVNENGFASPIGMGQGKFSVIDGPNGAKQIVNEFGNQDLFSTEASPGVFKAMKAAGVKSGTQGPIDYNSFKTMLKDVIKKE